MGRHEAAQAAEGPEPAHDEDVRFLRHSLLATRASDARARQIVRDWLRPMRLPDVTEGDILLAVSEAVANSAAHAYLDADEPGPVELTLLRDRSSVFVEISDQGRWRDPAETVGVENGCGLGISLIQRLSDAVLIHRSAHGGTRVTCTFPIPAAS